MVVDAFSKCLARKLRRRDSVTCLRNERTLELSIRRWRRDQTGLAWKAWRRATAAARDAALTAAAHAAASAPPGDEGARSAADVDAIVAWVRHGAAFKSNKLFGRLEDSALRAVCADITLRTFVHGQPIALEGDVCNSTTSHTVQLYRKKQAPQHTTQHTENIDKAKHKTQHKSQHKLITA